MEKLIKKLDEIFATYNVSDEDIAEVGELIASIGGDELVNEGEDFVVPDMGEANEAETDYED
ncbi:hypothetical protein [Fibrobacter sp.]|uniref:hypothetical protein n=1 Tax=Fibrobacter sp. TaxID=35828 RepID=UPI00388D0796